MPRSTTATISEGRNGDSPPGAFRIRVDENLVGLVGGMNLDTNGRVAKVHFVASSILSSNDGVRHLVWLSEISGGGLAKRLSSGGESRDVSSHFTSISQD
jgi:hypothetical protein